MRKLIAPVLIAVVAVLSAAPSSVAGGSGCETVFLTGQTQLNLANGRIEGTLTGTSGREALSIFSSTAILEENQRGSATFLKTTHDFTVVGGEHDGKKMTTLDNAVLVSSQTPGVVNAVSHVNIVEGASGFLVGVGSIDFRTGVTATWRLIVGRVCGL
jgi:FlaG/FlaF family flagellin (archaellin)